MSGPTKEAIEDFEKLADSFGLDCGGYWQFSGKEIAAFIQYIRAKERNDALERLILLVSSSARSSNFPREYLLQILMEMKVPT